MADDGQTGMKQRVMRHWFGQLPPQRQVEILEPEFKREHPTDEDVKRVKREAFGEDFG